MSEVNSVTHRNAELVHETTATVQSLSDGVEEWVSHVSGFQIDAAAKAATNQLASAARLSRDALQHVAETA
jgi:hypothetical protein